MRPKAKSEEGGYKGRQHPKQPHKHTPKGGKRAGSPTSTQFKEPSGSSIYKKEQTQTHKEGKEKISKRGSLKTNSSQAQRGKKNKISQISYRQK